MIQNTNDCFIKIKDTTKSSVSPSRGRSLSQVTTGSEFSQTQFLLYIYIYIHNAVLESVSTYLPKKNKKLCFNFLTECGNSNMYIM